MRNPHKWEELLPEEFFAEMARAPVVYWSCGAMEEHGLHMALGNDYIQMYEVCLRAAAITGGIVFPPVPFAPAYVPGISREELRSGKFELYHPSLWVSRELCERLYEELLESLADMGFKACLALGGHYPADKLLQNLEERLGGRVRNMLFHGGGTVSLLQAEIAALQKTDPHAGGHGGMWESALVMAARPEWADLERAERVTQAPFPSQLQKMNPAALAHIRDASIDQGEQLLEAAVRHAVERARALLAAAANLTPCSTST